MMVVVGGVSEVGVVRGTKPHDYLAINSQF